MSGTAWVEFTCLRETLYNSRARGIEAIKTSIDGLRFFSLPADSMFCQDFL